MDIQSGLSWENEMNELRRCGTQLTAYERSVVNLIASDNAYPRELSDGAPYHGHMIQEGILGKRPFAGAKLHDDLEGLAVRVACKVFNAGYANLQPHSCSQANQAAYHALLKQGDTVLALGFQAGGHLTHGLKSNFSGRAYNFVFYGTGADDLIDYDKAADLAAQHNPKLVICGSSSYPRLFDAQRLRAIADSVGARLMFDLSHEAGLIAAGVIPNPVPLADVVTMSIDKTLRGPFGGLILCRSELADAIDKAVHPGTQSSCSMRKVSDAAHALILTQGDDFKAYATNVLINAKVLESSFSKYPGIMVTGGTDKHYVVLDVKSAFNITGEEAERRLEDIGILSNRQTLPSDPSRRMADAGGLRLGSVWATSRGYDASDFKEISDIICECLSSKDRSTAQLSQRVSSLAARQRPADVWSPNRTVTGYHIGG